MVWAVIRPEKRDEVIASLGKAGFYAFTRIDVMGRGRQRGITVGSFRYEELPKVCLLVVVQDHEVERAVDTVKIAARTGNPGDGKIFITSLASVRRIRTRSPEM